MKYVLGAIGVIGLFLSVCYIPIIFLSLGTDVRFPDGGQTWTYYAVKDLYAVFIVYISILTTIIIIISIIIIKELKKINKDK